MVRKNAVPVWITFNESFCVKCGKRFDSKELILNAKFCTNCGKIKEKELLLRKNNEEIIWNEFNLICVNCAKPFQKGDKSLFGLYCAKCGKDWNKLRELRQPKLKKSKNIGKSIN